MKAEGVSKDKGTFPGSVSGTYLNVEVGLPWEPDRFDHPPDIVTRSSTFYRAVALPGSTTGRVFTMADTPRFTRSGATLDLQGQDSLVCDTPDQNYRQKSFHRQVTLRQSAGTRVLLGLSHKEHLFIGRGIYIPFNGPGGDLFPQSWGGLPAWIERFLEAGAR